MKWTKATLAKLKAAFETEAFSVKQAAIVLKKEWNYSNNTVYQVLHELVKEDFLTKLGRGFYRIAENKITAKKRNKTPDKIVFTLTSQSLIKAKKVLENKGVEFMITGPSALSRFTHNLPRRLIHLIYVINGAGEFASTLLKKENLRVFINPKGNELEMALQAFEDKDIFVIRERAKLEGNIYGRAGLERALVDTYFEATRRRIPFSEMEVGRIITNAFRMEKINIARLLSLAGRRGIKSEVKTIVKVLIYDVPLSTGITNEKVERVLKGIRA